MNGVRGKKARKGDRHLLPERPFGCYAQKVPVTFSRRTFSRRGFSLLEVILALAILGLAMASIGELTRLGMRNASVARDKSQAALLCESRMAEILAAGTLPETVQSEQLDNPSDPTGPAWLCSVAVESTDQDGLVAVRVTLIQDLPLEKRPVEFSLVRWLVDPSNTQTTTE